MHFSSKRPQLLQEIYRTSRRCDQSIKSLRLARDSALGPSRANGRAPPGLKELPACLPGPTTGL
eukprot:1047325-Pleurochrysis_carterae.AAC.2